MAVRFGEVNRYLTVLQFVDSPAEAELQGVFHAFESAILASNERVEEYAKYGFEGQLEIDEECGYLEDLLGAAFVMGQRYITRVLSWVDRLQRLSQRDGGAPWAIPEKKRRRHFLTSYGPWVADGAVRFAAAANSGANFFKHESEWRGDWERLGGQQGETYGDVKKLGVEQGSTGNMRAIAAGLGISDFDDFRPLLAGLDGWRDDVLGFVRAELKGSGLI